MDDISKIDKNFQVQSKLSRDGKKAYDSCEEPFEIYGLIKPKNDSDVFHRMPLKVAESVSENVASLSTHCAGGRVRFATDSLHIGITAEFESVYKASHFTLAGSAGFDLYMEENGNQIYLKTFMPPFDIENRYDSEIDMEKAEMRSYTINFPLYSSVKKLYIILDENAHVFRSSDRYIPEPPIVYYGSSITQGGCASRPGNSYQSIISRMLNRDYINLGFSGNAKGEDAIAEYISELKMSAFVYDYDHNAPSVEHLKNTHERMFRIIREKNPSLPIICVTRPVISYFDRANAQARKSVILKTVENANNEGDKNVYFIDGGSVKEIIGGGDSISVDGCHPNDLGFMSMAKLIGNKLSEIL